MAKRTISQRAVYAISCLDGGRAYVGSTVCVSGRWRHHRHYLRKGAHSNKPLQDAWTCLGEDAFLFTVLENVPTGDLLAAEQRWMSIQRKKYGLFNICPTAGSHAGKRHTEQAKSKISLSQIGREFSADHRAKLATAKAGERHPRSKLNEKAILEIRQRAGAGETRKAIGKDYAVSESTICQIVNLKRWGHVR